MDMRGIELALMAMDRDYYLASDMPEKFQKSSYILWF